MTDANTNDGGCMWSLFPLFLACGDKSHDSAELNQKNWLAADLMPLSSGACPNMSSSGDLVSFTSSGESRNVTIVFPDQLTEDMRLVFFFHGLMPENSNPTQQSANALDLQSFANQYNSVIVLPESPIWEMAGQRFHLWNIEDGTYANDVALFDDLRTCIANEFDVDLDTLVTAAFSGGSLFSTILIKERSDHLAAVVEMSGGADLTVPTFTNTFAPYGSPSHPLPVLLISGGAQDVWPDPGFTLVDFQSATETLYANLKNDNQFAVRCEHNSGHTITTKSFITAVEWLTQHRFNETSPFETGIDDWSDWCESSNQ